MAVPDMATDDPALDALDEFAETIEETAAEQRSFARRARRLSRARRRGESWSDVVSSDAEPSLPAASTRLFARLATANTRVRQALASALRAEGLRIEQIARVFGVTHQRISRVLARRSE
jgi:hypothetical protein